MIRFTKMHGLGNDFVIIDVTKQKFSINTKKAARIADRRFGIGCDQVILLNGSFMRIVNADGSEVDACGNATRCVALLTGKKIIETNAGKLKAEIKNDIVSVNMGQPKNINVDASKITEGKLKHPVLVDMGNPHMVFFVKNIAEIDLAKFGPKLEHHKLFPKRINVSIAEVKKGKIKLRVWERGAGLTLACGTAACAAFVAASNEGLVGKNTNVELPGGVLNIKWSGKEIIMSGTATKVFEGEFDDNLFS